jgi:hypothetical protein
MIITYIFSKLSIFQPRKKKFQFKFGIPQSQGFYEQGKQ